MLVRGGWLCSCSDTDTDANCSYLSDHSVRFRSLKLGSLLNSIVFNSSWNSGS